MYYLFIILSIIVLLFIYYLKKAFKDILCSKSFLWELMSNNQELMLELLWN